MLNITLKKIIKKGLIVISIIYIGLCTLVYFNQETIIFHPEKIRANYSYAINSDFEEIYFETKDGTKLNALLFKADSSKGVVIHYHGNAGSIRNWEYGATNYISLGYDFFVMDYRGFGKSEGEINGEELLFEDAQIAYDLMKERYDESQIIIEGYSIGSGIAANIAAKNSPKHLILCAPYYSLTDLMSGVYAIFPTFLLKYPLETYKRIEQINAPITIFHGTEDEVIPYDSSVRLSKLLHTNSEFIPLNGCKHNGVQNHSSYLMKLHEILN